MVQLLKVPHFRPLLLLAMLLLEAFYGQAQGACGGTLLTWDAGAGNSNWSAANNWSPNNIPNTTSEDALIVSDAYDTLADSNVTVGCVEIQSGGRLRSNNNRTLTVTGDYFKNLTTSGLQVNTNHNWRIALAGSSAQTFENVDAVNYIDISNGTSVTFTQSFQLRRELNLNTTGTTLNIDADLIIDAGTFDFTIPATNTVVVGAGVKLTVKGNLTVNGTLVLKEGATLEMRNSRTLQVNAGGQLRLEGGSGNPATIAGWQNGYYRMNVAGSLWAEYFSIERASSLATGVVISGTVSHMDHGEFHFIRTANDYALTIQSGASLPSTMDYISFYNDNAISNPRSIDASTYSGGAIVIDHWAGLGCSVEGCAYENDPSNQITWGTQAGTVLVLTNATSTGSPGATTNAGAAAKLFAIFKFNLNQASAASDITQIKITAHGTGSASDIDFINVYLSGASCTTQGAQVGGDIPMSGSPAQATINLNPGDLTVSDTSSIACLHVYLQTTATAQDDVYIGLQIAGTSDVINSQGYAFSDTSGPPVSASQTRINGDPTRHWDGSSSNAWRVNANWTGGNYPVSGNNCRIGAGATTLVMSADEVCQNAILPAGGAINWNNGVYKFNVEGALTIESGYTFSNAANSEFVMAGTTSQSISAASNIPALLTINNSGGSIVSIDGNTTVNGNVVVTNGILQIPAGITLTVLGNVTVASGATLDIEPGGTLKLANGRVLTINSGGTLEMIGTSGLRSTVTSLNTSSAYAINVNGTIKAQYYTIENMNTTGLTINAAATIDATYNLSNGTFSYPINNSTTMLRLYKAIPGNALSGMNFQTNGSSASSITNIYTDSSIGAGTLNITSYAGDLSGPSFENTNTYLISWSGLLNTLDLTQEATAPASAFQGVTYNMGRFGFKQTLAGASYVDTSLTQLKFKLIGTGSASDISAIRLYEDTDCDGAAGTLLGSGSYSGSPATVTFSSLNVLVPASTTSTQKRCVYLEYDISGSAVNSKTVGAEISSSTYIVNSQNYTINGATSPPVGLGTSTIVGSSTTWIGTVSTDWFNASNWNGGVPTSTLNCHINSSSNNPVIASGSASCKSLTINSGSLTISAPATLQVFGDLNNLATLTISGVLQMTDNGVSATNHTLSSTSTLSSLAVNKTAGGTITLGTTSLTLNALTMNGTSNNYNFNISNGKTLILPNGMTLTHGIFEIQGGGIVKVGNGQTITVNGGNFKFNGSADAYPQNLATKAKVTVNGAGTWGFNATSGNVLLKGFLIDYINTSGLVVGGTTTLENINGGQFTNLSNSYASVRALSINTTGTIPAAATNVGWNWLPNNTTPTSSDGYNVLYSSGCSSQSISFSGWFGDWADNVAAFDVSTKVSSTGCNIVLGGMASPVSLLSFSANGFNQAVELLWQTGYELTHWGFNILRQNPGQQGLVQVNPDIIRNINTSGSFQGSYRFIDSDVQNDQVYSYYLQQVDADGSTALYGPVYITPTLFNGNPPNSAPPVNEGNRPSDPNPGAPGTTNPGYQDLGDGVYILARSQNSLRLKISIANPTYSANALNAGYEDVAIDGYAKSLDVGKPQLLQKTILIEVDPEITSFQVDNAQVSQGTTPAKVIAPAADYVLNAGVLTATWAIDNSFYSTSQFLPTSFWSLENEATVIGDRHYLKIIVTPLSYNPVSGVVKNCSEIILDIGLDGSAWRAPPAGSVATPEVATNAIKLGMTSAGVYKLTYAQLVAADAAGPLTGQAISDLRLYFQGQEIPMEVTSADGVFGAGDSLRFYLPFIENSDDLKNYAILASYDVLESSTAAKRIGTLDGDPTGVVEQLDLGHWQQAQVFQDNLFVQSETIGTGLEHFFWKRIFAPYPTNTTFEYLDGQIDLTGALIDDSIDYKVTISLKGSEGVGGTQPHPIALYVNNMLSDVGQVVIESNQSTTAEFVVPSNAFFSGLNTLRVKALSSGVSAGDYNLIYIDKMKVDFLASPQALSNKLSLRNRYPDYALLAFNFSTNAVTIFDVSDITKTSLVANSSWVNNGGVWQVSFKANSGADQDQGIKYHLIADGQESALDSISLVEGYLDPLKGGSGADLIILGDQALLEASDELAIRRQSQGLSVRQITLKQVYGEFSHGRVSASGIREFIQYAKDNWSPAPKYLLILGDATYDPKDLFFFATQALMPMPVVGGYFFDFGSDNWFVSKELAGDLPRLAVGRIPTSNAESVRQYVQKIIDYENGDGAPGAGLKNYFVMADSDQDNEGFEAKAQSLAAHSRLRDIAMSAHVYTRASGTDATMHSQIISAFNQGPLMINYIGHGAEDRWADSDVFINSDVDSLTNSKWPIVSALNCLNAYFYDPDESFISLGEKLILKPQAGAIAFIGSTGMTTPEAQMIFANQFYSQFATLVENTASSRLGDVFMSAKIQMGDNAFSRDVQNSFILLGDPSMPLPSGLFTYYKEKPKNIPSQTDGPTSGGKSGGFGCAPAYAGNGSQGSAWWSELIGMMISYLIFTFFYKSLRRFWRQRP